ncbi:hypothetical protein [Haloarchaeobius iranensis]|uniref:Uncharacterized protein n=1 Tax=Haloarchaeobius iranensis TaxID=996166 RepID=A0A1G9TNH7_9EURY|nr:hypothetical protein [Haloarchaeobius iranensis]SDM48665.1 hypothetical protein SAMN05192554_10311 [Haloarchaeobius iranensis]
MTTTQPEMDRKDAPEHPAGAEQRARRVQREAVETACSHLAANGALTAERQQAVARLAARLRRRLVDRSVAAARGQGCREDDEALDPAVVAALFSE